MDGFHYYNIFDTKGMEYIVIIAFLLLLIPFWLLLNRKEQVKRQIRAILGVLTPAVLKVPQGVFHSPHHTWTHLERSGKARIGLDDLLLHITGDVSVRYQQEEGAQVKRGDLLAEITQEGKTLPVFSPISGKVVRSNPELEADAALLSADPYGKGWMYKVIPANWKAEVSSYYLAGEANAWLEDEIRRYKDFLAMNMEGQRMSGAMPVLQDGGELMDHSLSAMPAEIWQAFQKDFLHPVT